jgi:competence protein ComEC
VSYRDQVILLPGDIETAVEHKLREELSVLPAGVSVLVAPHHGSKTSSSSAFVSATKPRHVVFSAGYRHHFGHPNPKVVARYRAVRAQLWNTAEQGAIQFDWDRQGSLHVSTARSDERRYWY